MLTPAEQNEVLDRVADRIASTILERVNLEEFTVLPVEVAARLTGVKASRLKASIPIFAHGTRSNGVRLSDLRDFISKRTTA